MPFGVQTPYDTQAPNAAPVEPKESAPVEAAPAISPEGAKDSTKAQTTEEIKELLDLDKVERFRFDGKEMSLKELKSAYMMQSDYTKKTQELSETRRFADNFARDLGVVQQYPHRWEDFKKLYPKEYVAVAERALGKAASHETQKGNDSDLASIVNELRDKVSGWEKREYEQKVEQAQQFLDTQYAELSKKYTFADTDAIDNKVWALADKGTEVTKEILDKLFKESHAKHESRYNDVYKTKVTKQQEAGSKSKDVGPGGGTPGAAPRGFKTLKDAERAMLKDFGG